MNRLLSLLTSTSIQQTGNKKNKDINFSCLATEEITTFNGMTRHRLYDSRFSDLIICLNIPILDLYNLIILRDFYE